MEQELRTALDNLGAKLEGIHEVVTDVRITQAKNMQRLDNHLEDHVQNRKWWAMMWGGVLGAIGAALAALLGVGK